MGNKTTMWPERTHKIRRTLLSLKRVLHPVLFHSHLCLLFCCFCLTSCHSCPHLYSLPLTLSEEAYSTRWPATRVALRSPNGSRPQTDTESTVTFVFVRLCRHRRATRNALNWHRNLVISVYLSLGWELTPLFVNLSGKISTRYIVRTKQIVFDSSMQFHSFTLH